jgi:pectinesterase
MFARHIHRLICPFILLYLTFPAFAQKSHPTELTVALDGSGDHRSIQAAIQACRDLGEKRVKIHIKKGIYREKLIIPSWKTNISLIGEDRDSVIITGNDHTGKPVPRGVDVHGLDKYQTYTSHTVLVEGNGTLLENLTIENTAGRVGQAVALHVEGDGLIVRNCRILGNQDTLYAASSNSRQFYVDCYIEGTTDFIFGEATAVFDRCEIRSLSDSYITAAATRQDQAYGFVFLDCKLTAEPGVQRVYLGRPWRPYARTVFIRTEMGGHILPEGWHHWPGDVMFPDKEKTAFYAEYGSSGPGKSNGKRVGWSKQLSARKASRFTAERILGSFIGFY